MATNPTTTTDYKIRRKLGRSAITNGVVELDARSKVARRFRDICRAIYADQGGEENCAEARLQLIRRFSAACCLAEAMEAKMANGAGINIAEHAALTSTLVKVASRIGVDRRSRNITPTLSDYLRSEQEADDVNEEAIE